jgi:uncharacterized protein YbjT (DUF2867 family)
MKVLILGAAGQIPRYLVPMLLEQTDTELVLYARNASQRVSITDKVRGTVIDGDFSDTNALKNAMQGVDVVYMNAATGDLNVLKSLVSSMKEAGTKKLILASILGIYDEVQGAFGEWNKSMIGDASKGDRREAADYIESSGVDYTILRLTWLYNQDGNYDYEVTQKDEPFKGAQVTRQAVAQLIVDVVNDAGGVYRNTSLGVSEPDTDYDKPSFY